VIEQTILNIRLDHQMTGVDSIFPNMVIYLRGSLGFGEEALQSLLGKVGSQVLIIYLDLLRLRRWVFFPLDSNCILSMLVQITSLGISYKP
jgi:hypothetical protein